MSRIQRTDVSIYSFVNKTKKDWNHLPAGVLASFPSKLNAFRKRAREAAFGGGLV
jgi:hypothetical protein